MRAYIGSTLAPWIEASGETMLVATREKLIRAATHHTAELSVRPSRRVAWIDAP